MTTKTIVLIHGLFVTRASWAPWVAHYEARGYRCLAPAYPERELPVAALRARQPDAATAAVTLERVLERFTAVIASLDQPPILIGHSFGGLLTQLLLQRGLGACGVAIDSVPPPGVLSLRWSFLRSLWPVLNPFVPKSRSYLMSLPHFRYAFVNTLPPAEQQRHHEEQVVPESRRLARAALGSAARIRFDAMRPPLLLIAGEKDHIIPASLNRTNWREYQRSPAHTDFHEFPGRDHFLIASPGWQEVADHALAWALDAVAGTSPARRSDGS